MNTHARIRSLRTRIAVAIFALFSAGELYAQHANLSMHREILGRYDEILNSREVQFHSSVKPYLVSDLQRSVNVDSIQHSLSIHSGRDTKQESESPKGSIGVDVLMAIQPGFESSDTTTGATIESGIGVGLVGKLGSKWNFNLNYFTANGSYPQYVLNRIQSTKVVPSQGYGFGTKTGFHHKNFSGYLSFSPSAIFNFQVGQGKNFWGEGYRSLLLSDVANNYSFFKITTTIWKIKYVNLFTNFKDIRNTDGTFWKFHNKYGTLHYLSWNVTKRINLTFYESVIWQPKDTLHNRGYDLNYLNPIIFFRPVEYSLGSSDNSLMGLGLTLKVTKKLKLYSQLILDEFLLGEVKAGNGWWANKQGVQVGFNWFDFLTINNLSLQSEFNYVRPYTYSHGSALQNYGHFNQPLAHPLGANFWEVVSILRFQKNRWSLQGKMIYARYGADSAGINFGGNIYQEYSNRPGDYGHETTQGIANNLALAGLQFNYIIYPKSNLMGTLGLMHRARSNANDRYTTDFFYVGLRTDLFNRYYDY